jgi:hypothetical protein
MALMIEIPNHLASAIQLQAMKQGVAPEVFVYNLLEQSLPAATTGTVNKPLQSGLGMWEKYGPGPTEEEIDENRRDMLQGFPKDLS